ncbi:MAG: PKD domain-containing protein [Syntrophobacteraceae bacterium]
MKTQRVALLVFLLSILVGGIQTGYPGQIVENTETNSVLQPRGLAPLHFILNQGQLDERIKYYSKNARQEIYFTEDGVYLAIAKGKPENDPLNAPLNLTRNERPTIETQIVRLAPVSMARQVEIHSEDTRQAKVNWYVGNDQRRWKTNIPTYGAVTYRGARDGLDVRFYGKDRHLEYDLIVKPGQDPSQVKMACSGVDYYELTEEGDLVINLKGGATLLQKRPTIYQMINGDRVSIEGGFTVERPATTRSASGAQNLALAEADDDMVYGFDVGEYDRSLPVVIDPVIMYADYLELGGTGEDYSLSIDVDSTGCAYTAGYTSSTEQSFSIPGAIPIGTLTTSSYNIFVKKFDALGGDVHTTYLGGNDNSRAYAIASDNAGNVYLTGQTSATNYPTVLPIYGTNRGNGDSFLTKLAPDGTVSFSTYIGGADEDMGYGIAIDTSGCAYITGYTYSVNYPTSNAYCITHSSGDMDAFITKINTITRTLTYSTFVGGDANNCGKAVAVDSSGSAYVTGWTYSSNFPVFGSPFQPEFAGIQDAFVLKLGTSGSTLAYSTYLGGSDADAGMGIALDSSGNAYVTGKTNSTDYPVSGDRSQFGSNYTGGTDGFVTKLDSSGSALTYSTYLGGADVDIPAGIRVNTSNEAFIVGETASNNFPLVNAFHGAKDGSRAAFITKLNAAGSSAVFSSYYLGNEGNDAGTGIALDKSAGTGVYFTGYTTTADYYSNAFAVKLNDVTTPSMDVVSPNGGESIQAGTNKTIRWSYTNSPDTTVTIQLLQDATVVATLATAYTIGTNGNGYYVWTVPCDRAPGSNYKVKITTTNGSYSDASDEAFTITQAIPSPEFTANGVAVSVSPVTVATGDEVQFQDVSSCGTPAYWEWDFGDGRTSSEQNPKHIYTAVGQYDISLTLTGPGWQNTKYRYGYLVVTLPVPPTPGFSAAPTLVAVGDQVQFTDESTGYITSWSWNFGDGSPASSEKNPKHAYASDGLYNVTLTVSNPAGSPSITKTGIIDVSLPKPIFTATPNPVGVNNQLTFSGSSTGTGLSSWQWDFGDGETVTYAHSDPNHANPVHTYTSTGDKTVTLTVTGTSGTRSKTETIKVAGPPIPDFTASPTTVATKDLVQFTDASQDVVTSWSWDFGDGSPISHAQNPTHAYTADGHYTVTLTVSGPGGENTLTKGDYISVSVPNPDFEATPTTVILGHEVNFSDLSTGDIDLRSWTFGDGGTSTDTNPVHLYATPGTYDVSLTASGPTGSRSKTKTAYIRVVAIPQPAFSATPDPVAMGAVAQFTDESLGDVTSWLWSFGDGQTSIQRNPQHAYSAVGVYNVTLTASGPAGSASFTRAITVTPPSITITSPNGGESYRPGDNITIQWSYAGSVGSKVKIELLKAGVRAATVTVGTSVGSNGTGSYQYVIPARRTPGTDYRIRITSTSVPASQSTSLNNFAIAAPLPVAAFRGLPLSGNSPLSVRFTNTTTGSVTSWNWDFGDGQSSPAKTTTHPFGPGIHTVKLTATGPGGSDIEEKVHYVRVNPIANFTADTTTGYEALTVQFHDTSQGGNQAISAWAWNFGDGGTSTEQHPTHVYTTPGVYNVTLMVTSPSGSGQTVKKTFISVFLADFTATPLSGDRPLAVSFTDRSSGAPTGWSWDFGDGSAPSTSQNPTHTYSSPGFYNVTLTVSGPKGTGTETKTNCISVKPDADFTASSTFGVEPHTVDFFDASIGTVTSWAWNFGDGTSSTEQNPAHLYTNPGTYTVTLTVYGPNGSNVETKTNYITIYRSDFSATPLTGAGSLTTAFTDLSTGSPTSWTWNFGDGGTSNAQNPTHTYSSPGFYTVTLTVSGPKGTGTETKTNYVSVTPDANFSASPTVGMEPLTVSFSDATVGSVTSYAWNFGDGGTSTLQNPSHVYTSPGTYTVSLTVTGPGGSNVETKTSYITVYRTDFSATPRTGTGTLTTTFTDLSTGGPTSWEWDFGDGTPKSYVRNPSHTYSSGGVYTVSLTVSGPNGTSQEIKTGYITVYYTIPAANFTASTVSGPSLLNVSFTNSSTGVVDTWLWEFGDGSTSTEQNPSHVYSTAGVYTVKLTATGPGGTNTRTRLSYITVTTPMANFTATTATSGVAVLPVQFTDTSTGTITTRTWDFGDGTTLATTDLNVSHTYTTAGTRTVKLTVSGPGGSNTMTRTGYVVVTAPTANFTASTATSGVAALTVGFTDSSTGTIDTRTWDFGDGTTLVTTDLTVSHTYTTPGTRTVKLTISGPAGTNTLTRTGYVVVSAPTITVTQPNTAVTWSRGSTKTIMWTFTGTPEVAGPTVKVEILKGTTVVSTLPITSIGTGGSGSCTWTIPTTFTTGTTFKVRVTSTSNSSYKDSSNVNFTIN